MATVTINRGEAPVKGLTLEMSPEEAVALEAVITADVGMVMQTSSYVSMAQVRKSNPAVYEVLASLTRALSRAGLQ